MNTKHHGVYRGFEIRSEGKRLILVHPEDYPWEITLAVSDKVTPLAVARAVADAIHEHKPKSAKGLPEIVQQAQSRITVTEADVKEARDRLRDEE